MRCLIIFFLILAQNALAQAQTMQKIHAHSHVIATRIGLLEGLIHSFFQKETLESLKESNQIETNTKKRLEQTIRSIFTVIEHGFDSYLGRQAIAHIQQKHKFYQVDEKTNAMRHTLSCFVVGTVRAMKNISGMPVSLLETQSITQFYQRLGEALAIKEIPKTYQEFEAIFEANLTTNNMSDEEKNYARNLAKQSIASSNEYFFRPFSWLLAPLRSELESATIGLFDAKTKELLGLTLETPLMILHPFDLWYQVMGRRETADGLIGSLIKRWQYNFSLTSHI